MKVYICKLCNYNSHIKTNFNKHLKTNKHHKNEKNLSSKNGFELIKRPQKDHFETIFQEKEPKKRPKKDHFCEYCLKGFVYKTHLYRHQKSYCKIKNNQDMTELKLQIMKEREMFKNELNNQNKEKEKLFSYIEKLIEKKGVTNINIENQTINVNNYGCEDISHITDGLKVNLLKLPYGMVQKMIEYVHFNKNKPENKNIALTNKKEKLIKVFKDNKWKYQDKDAILNELIQTNYSRLDDFYEKIGFEELSDIHKNRYKKYQNLFDDQDSQLLEQIKKDSEMILLSDNLDN